MNEQGRTAAIELIRRIQAQGGSHDEFRALECATNNPDVWIVFDVLELESFPPEKIFDLLSNPP